MASVGNIADTVEGKSKELEQFMESLSSLSARFVTIAEKADTVMTDVASISSGLSESDIKGVVTSFKALLDNMNDPDGTIGKLFVDNSVYDSVDELLKDIDSLIRQIEENPKKYIRISIF
jgi:phospholipid/cholesterol/gamma-HCH transport system substrate-binding protein